MSASAFAASPNELWWDTISGPARFVRDVASALRGGKHVCILSRDGLPWHATFRSRVRDALVETENDLQFVDDLEFGTGDMPGEVLVRYFGLDAMYRASKTHEEFLNERRALKNYIVCAAAREQEIEQWVKLMRAYSPGSADGGLLLLDMRLSRAPAGVRNVKFMEYWNYVTEYDALMFAGLLTDSAMSDESKRYSAAVTVALFGTDVERSSQSAGSGDAAQDPAERLVPLLADDFPADELARRLWKAQAQTLFPLIMQQWRYFFEEWRDRIDEAFEYASSHLPYGVQGTDGETICSPDEMEIANVRYLMRRRRCDDSGQILYIPDETARERLELLYSMRNQIAHGKVCKAEDVAMLVGSAGQRPGNAREMPGKYPDILQRGLGS
ncbi:MAG: hypothetical protein LBC21_04400 [Oscillospiraceae bacterium]|jgi:hypothetical protein|nr:hypothetical protein [Oscillospiraceae bacterium]